MLRSGRFERRLLIALVLFSLVPTILLVGIGTAMLREAVSLQTTPAGWERLAESGQRLLEQAEQSGDPSLETLSEIHRQELSESVLQAQRWGYVNRRVLSVLPWFAAGFLLVLGLLAVRSARGIARELVRPIDELVDWSGRVGRGDPLPATTDGDGEGEFAVLRCSFRSMVAEIERSRERALENARIRSSVALARGVSHELKNALTPLMLAVRSLQRSRTLGPDEREPLEVIEAESIRLDELARAFSRFGRPPEGVASDVDLAELLDYLVRTHLPETVECRLHASPDAPHVEGYHDSLSRAFANLLLNAVEAMGGVGRIEVEVLAQSGEEVVVRIADSGPGVPETVRERIWDPDFTSKARGTGLGLALVRQTIHAHGGRIEVVPGIGGGAEFRVHLPVGGAAAASLADAHSGFDGAPADGVSPRAGRGYDSAV